MPAQADFIPSTLDAADDRDPDLSDECNQTMTGYEPIRCDFYGSTYVFGDERLPGPTDEFDAERTVVMYGGSKIWHWPRP
ncbi:hypothetical protein GCM10029992_18200 [Glycomyces albus]